MKNHTIKEYEQKNGWSSKHFASYASTLLRELELAGVVISIGRTVIHLNKNGKELKAYVHHNGRSQEYATLVNNKIEVLTVHYTEFSKLDAYLKEYFN